MVVELFAKSARPVKVGDALNTAKPEPVSSVRIAASFAEVSIEVVATFELKVLQSADARRPRPFNADAVGMLRVCVEPDDEKPQPVAEEEVVAKF